MTIEQLGSLGEFIASIATLVTLIYLALQIRFNSDTVRTSNYWQVSALTNQFSRQISENPEVNDLYLRGLEDFSGLSREEQSRFHLLLSQLFHAYQMLNQLRKKQLVDEEMYLSQFHAIGSLFQSPGVRQWWESSEHWFERDFADLISAKYFDEATTKNGGVE